MRKSPDIGLSSDAGHITQPSVEGPARAVRMALEEAAVAPDEVDYINAHGTGTRLNDVTETQVIKAGVRRSCSQAGDQFHKINAWSHHGRYGSHRTGGDSLWRRSVE